MAEEKSLREKLEKKILSKSDIPIIVLLTVLFSFFVIWRLRVYSPDLSLNLFSELIGVAFTLFIIDTLLVRSKNKLWKLVHRDIDYLISRNVNRLRDGIATRIFKFEPDLKSEASFSQNIETISRERADFLAAVDELNTEELLLKIEENDFFNDENYAYFDEKAEDFWEILNMKYSEYLAPELVSELIELHTGLKDLCSAIRQHEKSQILSENKEYYQSLGKASAAQSLVMIIERLNQLKEAGYSENAKII
ncbi:hypothetical protein LJ207_06395 [Halanaerobium sp. Z-7514]|uniref:Uncharacterized protein n=1 Tax=Halanaerobium polyolivorans TaxID=2886943 RepID=A0AAW4WYX0_9FIRM|nr:hypothetical protein [Halanaerobium polyolivorans]MCC3144947.1 hypothetical protein [Halanaerobium polyolivorans]RQD78789.1 MAG: hypothetical protein D5S01_00940 [Halanaerobium sp. MSAO_Bac5]